MLGEPQRTQADLNFRLFGIPVRIHPFFWVMCVMLGPLNGGAPELLTWVVAALLSLLVHELGHALVIRAFGLHPWIVLYGMGGLTIHDNGYRSRGSGSMGQILISIAGPAAGFLLVGVLLLGCVLAGYSDRIVLFDPLRIIPVVVLSNLRLTTLFYDISFICIFWGLMNLLPIYPLDGGKIARELFLLASPREGIRQSLLLSITAAVVMAVVGFALWHDWFIAMFFGYFAYSNYVTLQTYGGRNPW